MRKTFALAIATCALLVASCTQQTITPKEQTPSKKVLTSITTNLDPSEIHNPVIEVYWSNFNPAPVENMTRIEYNLMVENMAKGVDSMYGSEAGLYFRQRGYVMMDELGAFQNDILNIDLAQANIIAQEKDIEFKRVLTFVNTFTGTGNIVDAAQNEFANPNTPEAVAYLNMLAGAERSANKRGQGGIFQTPQYPMKSHNQKVADADAAGYKYEYCVAMDQKVGMSVAMYRAGLSAAMMSATKDRDLRAKGE